MRPLVASVGVGRPKVSNRSIPVQTVLPSEFKRGMVLMLDGIPHAIEEFHIAGTAQTRHRMHARLRRLKGAGMVERVFNEGERVPVAALEQRFVEFSYQNGEDFVFSDPLSFDELTVSAEQLGDRRQLLREGLECRALRLDGQLLDIVLPPSVSLRITETAPPGRSGTDSNWKPAILETGVEIMVPQFIDVGDVVRVSTEDRKYGGKDTGNHGAQS